jgi:hypothetical protein
LFGYKAVAPTEQIIVLLLYTFYRASGIMEAMRGIEMLGFMPPAAIALKDSVLYSP